MNPVVVLPGQQGRSRPSAQRVLVPAPQRVVDEARAAVTELLACAPLQVGAVHSLGLVTDLLVGEWPHAMQIWQTASGDPRDLVRARVDALLELAGRGGEYARTCLLRWISAHLPLLCARADDAHSDRRVAPTGSRAVGVPAMPLGVRRECMHNIFALPTASISDETVLLRALPGRCRAREFDKFLRKYTNTHPRLEWFRCVLLNNALGILPLSPGLPTVDSMASVYRCTMYEGHGDFWGAVTSAGGLSPDTLLRAVRGYIVCMVSDCPSIEVVATARAGWNLFLSQVTGPPQARKRARSTDKPANFTLATSPSTERALVRALVDALEATPHASSRVQAEVERLVRASEDGIVGLDPRVRHAGDPEPRLPPPPYGGRPPVTACVHRYVFRPTVVCDVEPAPRCAPGRGSGALRGRPCTCVGRYRGPCRAALGRDFAGVVPGRRHDCQPKRRARAGRLGDITRPIGFVPVVRSRG